MIKYVKPAARMSQAVVYAGLVYTAGQVDDSAPDVTGQTRGVLAKIDALLESVGSDKSSILSANIWLADIATGFELLNPVWESWVDKDRPPARATVESRLAGPSYLVEISVIAAINDERWWRWARKSRVKPSYHPRYQPA